MGIGGISVWQLLIILLIVVMLFGTKKLRNLGSDLGGALKGFKTAMRDDEGEGDGEEGKEEVTEQSEQADIETAEPATKNAE